MEKPFVLLVRVVQVRCLNEASVGSCRNILRPWHTRLDAVETPLRSNEDEDEQEVLIHVP